MALPSSRLPAPETVLFGAAILFVAPAFAFGILSGTASAAVGVGVALATGVVFLVVFGLYAPVIASFGTVALVVPEPSLGVVVSLPVIAAVAACEYVIRRLVGHTGLRLSEATEGALTAGVIIGLLWTWLVHLLSPGSDDFGVVSRSVGVEGYAAPLAELAFVVVGPLLVVGMAVTLVGRFGLLSPLAFATIEVGSFLSDPSGGDSVGSAASLLWPIAVPLLLGVAALELWLRLRAVPVVRQRVSSS
jgi:hypothetical protein